MSGPGAPSERRPREHPSKPKRETPWGLVGLVAVAVGLVGFVTSWSAVSLDWSGEGLPYIVVNALLVAAGSACLIAARQRR